jgi:hypothetical protein
MNRMDVLRMEGDHDRREQEQNFIDAYVELHAPRTGENFSLVETYSEALESVEVWESIDKQTGVYTVGAYTIISN